MEMSVQMLQPPSRAVTLSRREVHVWISDIEKLSCLSSDFEQVLSVEELQRTRKYHFHRDRARFSISRGLLRIILGRYYLNIEPRHISFRVGTKGKPYLEDRWAKSNICFNRSDSGGLALFAFTKGHEIGVDVEQMRTIDARSIVEGSFSKAEIAEYYKLGEEKKHEAFYSCWTRKEAFLKAIGEGLHFPLDQFEVSLAPDEPARLLRVVDKAYEASQWSLRSFVPKLNYKAALAVQCVAFDVIFWRYPS